MNILVLAQRWLDAQTVEVYALRQLQGTAFNACTGTYRPTAGESIASVTQWTDRGITGIWPHVIPLALENEYVSWVFREQGIADLNTFARRTSEYLEAVAASLMNGEKEHE